MRQFIELKGEPMSEEEILDDLLEFGLDGKDDVDLRHKLAAEVGAFWGIHAFVWRMVLAAYRDLPKGLDAEAVRAGVKAYFEKMIPKRRPKKLIMLPNPLTDRVVLISYLYEFSPYQRGWKLGRERLIGDAFQCLDMSVYKEWEQYWARHMGGRS